MKRLLLVAFATLSLNAIAQTNTFPTSGNVGIGTTNPQTSLDVNGNIRASYSGADIGGSITIANPTKTGNGQASSWCIYNMSGGYNNSLQFWAYDNVGCTSGGLCNNRFTLMDNGNVGIGTTSPQTLLNVNVGAGGSNGLAGVRIGGLGNYESLELGIDGDYDGMIRCYGNNLNYYAGHWKVKGIAATENHSHNWYTSKAGSTNWSIIKMTLNQDGNLGIGTTNPAYKLDVLGTIRAKEVLVNLDGGADFVFEKDYKLLPIEHVANYVQKNKHLPDIPSANEMVKNGVSMGDMQVKLLQKVEELTLYAIQQNNKIAEQDKNRKTLEEKLTKQENQYNALLAKVEMLTKQIEKK